MPKIEQTGLSLISDLLIDIVTSESERTTWHQQINLTNKILLTELILLQRHPDRRHAIPYLVKMKVQADELILKISDLKASPIMSIAEKRIMLLNELSTQLEKVANEKLLS